MLKKLMVMADRTELGFYQGVLEAEGIACTVKNEFLSGAMGELPVNETWPELWVNENDLPRARQLLAAMASTPAVQVWRCPDCGELIEGQFTDCWRCSRLATPD